MAGVGLFWGDLNVESQQKVVCKVTETSILLGNFDLAQDFNSDSNQ